MPWIEFQHCILNNNHFKSLDDFSNSIRMWARGHLRPSWLLTILYSNSQHHWKVCCIYFKIFVRQSRESFYYSFAFPTSGTTSTTTTHLANQHYGKYYEFSFSSKPKIGCSSSITNIWTCSSSFDVQKMMFKFVRCSIKWCLTHH